MLKRISKRSCSVQVGIVLSLLCLMGLISKSYSLSIAGNWQTVSDKTNHVTSVINIWKVKSKKQLTSGQYFGKIVKIYPVDGAKITDRCQNCGGKFYNRPVLGLPVIYNMKQQSSVFFNDGKIMDPKSGSLYSCNMRLSTNGNTLTVRGYVGFSLLGRSQTWYRVKKDVRKGGEWTRV